MADRYSRVYTLPNELYKYEAPVMIAAGALLKDNLTNRVLAQLKLHNLGTKAIKAATVAITSYDTAGREIGALTEHTYLDLNIARNQDFGEQTAIYLNDDNTRSFAVAVKEVIFADNTIYSGADTPWQKPLEAKVPLRKVLKEPDLLKQYAIDTQLQDSQTLYKPQEIRDLWRCTCGTLNKNEQSHCFGCNSAKSAVFAKLDESALREHLAARLEIEEKEREEQLRLAAERAAREKEQKAQAEKRKAKTKKHLTIAVSLAIVLVLAAGALSMIMKNNAYNEAIALRDSGEYNQALLAFGKLDGYKDAHELNLDLRRQLSRQITIAAGDFYTVGLKNNGTVVAVGDNDHGQCEVEDWQDIVAVFTGYAHVVGLKEDGTVVAVGYNNSGQCEVADWQNIKLPEYKK